MEREEERKREKANGRWLKRQPGEEEVSCCPELHPGAVKEREITYIAMQIDGHGWRTSFILNAAERKKRGFLCDLAAFYTICYLLVLLDILCFALPSLLFSLIVYGFPLVAIRAAAHATSGLYMDRLCEGPPDVLQSTTTQSKTKSTNTTKETMQRVVCSRKK